MRWTERQRAMLREMGIGPWQREPGEAEGVVAVPAQVGAPVVAAVAPRAAALPPARPVVEPTEAAVWPAADWLVVGEPPAADSAAAEAQLLDNVLRAIGVARSSPARGARAAVLALAEGEAGTSRLQAAIAGVRPRCILAFGRGAARAVLGSDEPLGALRSAEHRRNGVPVVVTCSLAFLLRHADEKARVWAELCRAVRVFDAGNTPAAAEPG